jgi:peptidoglycan/xylan/chitin deacetylase (PgdA/CDA1 family)
MDPRLRGDDGIGGGKIRAPFRYQLIDGCMEDRLPILMYHSLDDSGSGVSVAPALFAAQMSRLAQLGVHGITLREAVSHRAAHGRWPAAAAVLTFDDGYASVIDDALPILRRHQFAATVFMVSGHIGGSNDWAPAPAHIGRRDILTAAQARTLAEAGIEIGAHTRTHPNLQHTNAAQLEAELRGCRSDLEHCVGEPVTSFAYPFGIISHAAVQLARQVFEAACTTTLGRAGADDLHLLPRLDMYYIRSPQKLEQAVTGRLDRYLGVRRWGRRLRRAYDAARPFRGLREHEPMSTR